MDSWFSKKLSMNARRRMTLDVVVEPLPVDEHDNTLPARLTAERADGWGRAGRLPRALNLEHVGADVDVAPERHLASGVLRAPRYEDTESAEQDAAHEPSSVRPLGPWTAVTGSAR